MRILYREEFDDHVWHSPQSGEFSYDSRHLYFNSLLPNYRDEEKEVLRWLRDDFINALRYPGHGFKHIVFAVLPAAVTTAERKLILKNEVSVAHCLSNVKLSSMHSETLFRGLLDDVEEGLKMFGLHLPKRQSFQPRCNPQLICATFEVNVDPH